MLDLIEIEPKSPARSAVIWLHGLGADGPDFEPLVLQWQLADEFGARFVLPHAPVQPVTLNSGMRMRAWYDIYDLGFDGGEDAEGIERARQTLLGLIEREQQRGISSENILLAGFSQGGAVAFHTAVRWEKPLAGVLVLSAYLPLRQSLATQKRADPESLVLRMDHGEQDPVVPYLQHWPVGIYCKRPGSMLILTVIRWSTACARRRSTACGTGWCSVCKPPEFDKRQGRNYWRQAQLAP